jgi:hypothetical protein
VFVGWFVLIVGAVYTSQIHEWPLFSLALGMVIAEPLLLWATRFPTRCGVATRNGLPLPKPHQGSAPRLRLPSLGQVLDSLPRELSADRAQHQLVRIQEDNQLPVWALWCSFWATVAGTVIGLASLLVALVK